jgi:hypothetical protein
MRDDVMPLSVLGLLAGALIASGGVWYLMQRESNKTAMMFAFGDGAKAQQRAMQAYQHEDPDVAIWELRHLAELKAEHLRRGLDSSRSLQMWLFLTHGRLAKLYRQKTRESNALIHAEMAIAAYKHVNPTNSTITNFTTLLEWIQKIDERATKETRYE